jgi:bifunctional UDP-N-acetylglucosamine pyrophosphorylase/glucosamine-1-phosphate N-acetyltransferase
MGHTAQGIRHRAKGVEMKARNPEGIMEALVEKGVNIPCPESVEIGPEVNPERISGEGVTIHAGCRIFGSRTLLLTGVELGEEGPVTIRDCFVGREARLKGGVFEASCLLEGASLGSGAQVRAGCLLEEGARGGHAVGLKQTILFPFVTLGSLINFCDCLMAGGTDARNHSEVGSSYVHFNYTPNQDKATGSLIGDVPRGVMVNQPPVFLGGQGGMVGPVRIGYGIAVAAGTIIRKDLLQEGTMVLGQSIPRRIVPFHPGLYTGLHRLISQNVLYLANLIALRRWYLDIRSRFTGKQTMEEALLEGAVDVILMGVKERLKRLGEVAARMPRSIEIHKALSGRSSADVAVEREREFLEQWPRMEKIFLESLEDKGDADLRTGFMASVDRGMERQGPRYLAVIKGLDEREAGAGTAWLQGLVDGIRQRTHDVLTAFPHERNGK